jgi:6-pyruvoyltetrahydropterin/6-carboxytetrahydropterin synthase
VVRELYQVEKRFTFEASHRLPKHDGKHANTHGHSWAMTVVVEGSALHRIGPYEDMLLDTSDINTVVKCLIEEYLDHQCLNISTGLKNPTSEALARWVYMRLEPRIRNLRESEALRLHSVRIEEGGTSTCTFQVAEMEEAKPRPHLGGHKPPWTNGKKVLGADTKVSKG